MTKKRREQGEKQERVNRFKNFMTDERTRYTLSLLLLFFILYLFFAMLSFLFTASADQSRLVAATSNRDVTNWTGYIGAKIANMLVNVGFGVSSFACCCADWRE